MSTNTTTKKPATGPEPCVLCGSVSKTETKSAACRWWQRHNWTQWKPRFTGSIFQYRTCRRCGYEQMT